MNKKILRNVTALCAALVLMGGFSVTAFAQTPEGEDDTNDSGVVYEEPQKEEPLTPDGNATLVDDFGGNKQLITVTTKSGNYFYISLTGTTREKTPSISLIKWTKPTLWHSWTTGKRRRKRPLSAPVRRNAKRGKSTLHAPYALRT